MFNPAIGEADPNAYADLVEAVGKAVRKAASRHKLRSNWLIMGYIDTMPDQFPPEQLFQDSIDHGKTARGGTDSVRFKVVDPRFLRAITEVSYDGNGMDYKLAEIERLDAVIGAAKWGPAIPTT